METAIVSVICIALIVIGGMTMSQGFLTSVDSTSAALEKMSKRDEEIMRTELSSINATLPSANILEVTLRNSGQVKLASFDKWDVIVQYYDNGDVYYVKWLSYTDNITLGNNQWKKSGIYLNAEDKTAEAFEPGILNPEEEIVIEAKLNPPVGDNTTNLMVVSTPNGVSTSIIFER